jgi:hypothetical protein
MIKGFVIQRPTPGLFVDSNTGKTTLGTGNNLKRYLIRATVGRKFNCEPDIQGFGG